MRLHPGVPLGPGPARWKVSREQHRVVRVRTAEERRRRVLALVADASADGDLHGLTAALQRVCRAATAALGLRGAAVHVMAESERSGRGGLLGRRGPRRRRAAVHRQRGPRPGWRSAPGGPCSCPCSTRPTTAGPASPRSRWCTASARCSRSLSSRARSPSGSSTCTPTGPDRWTPTGSRWARAFAAGRHRSSCSTATPSPGAGELDAGLSASLVDRARIHQAQGMVMVDLRVTLAEALSRMRARAFASDTTLLERGRPGDRGDS